MLKILHVEDNVDSLTSLNLLLSVRLNSNWEQYFFANVELVKAAAAEIPFRLVKGSEQSSATNVDIVGAATFEMAVRLLNEEGPFSVVITDHSLSGSLTGFHLAEQIRAGEMNHGPNGTPPDVLVLACCGIRDEVGSGETAVFLKEGYNAGIDAFFIKPSNIDKLIQVLRDWLTGGQRPEKQAFF